MNVYELFIKETENLNISADMTAVNVVAILFRACKRAQLVADGELAPIEER